MAKYAAKTEVGTDKTRTEIERTVTRYGATHFGYMSEPDRAQVAFRMQDRQVRFAVPMPNRMAREFTHTPTGLAASATAQETKFEQAARQRWRALLLVVKAKLEAVDAGIAEFDQEFFPYLVLPSGRTVYEESIAQVQTMITSGDRGQLTIGSGPDL